MRWLPIYYATTHLLDCPPDYQITMRVYNGSAYAYLLDLDRKRNPMVFSAIKEFIGPEKEAYKQAESWCAELNRTAPVL